MKIKKFNENIDSEEDKYGRPITENLVRNIIDNLKMDYDDIEEADPELIVEIIEKINNYVGFHVTKALKAAHKNMQLPEEDLDYTLSSYPLTNIK